MRQIFCFTLLLLFLYAVLVKSSTFAKNSNNNEIKQKFDEYLKKRNIVKEHSYCCAINDKNEIEETRTRTISVLKQHKTKQIVGYKPCTTDGSGPIKLPSIQDLLSGFYTHTTAIPIPFRTTPCKSDPIYEEVTYMKAAYELQYYKVIVSSANCPPEHQICCDGYKMILGQCIENSVVTEDLEELLALGIIG